MALAEKVEVRTDPESAQRVRIPPQRAGGWCTQRRQPSRAQRGDAGGSEHFASEAQSWPSSKSWRPTLLSEPGANCATRCSDEKRRRRASRPVDDSRGEDNEPDRGVDLLRWECSADSARVRSVSGEADPHDRARPAADRDGVSRVIGQLFFRTGPRRRRREQGSAGARSGRRRPQGPADGHPCSSCSTRHAVTTCSQEPRLRPVQILRARQPARHFAAGVGRRDDFGRARLPELAAFARADPGKVTYARWAPAARTT